MGFFVIENIYFFVIQIIIYIFTIIAMAIINRNIRHNGVEFEKWQSMDKDHDFYKEFSKKGFFDADKKDAPKAPDAPKWKKDDADKKDADKKTNIVG